MKRKRLIFLTMGFLLFFVSCANLTPVTLQEMERNNAEIIKKIQQENGSAKNQAPPDNLDEAIEELGKRCQKPELSLDMVVINGQKRNYRKEIRRDKNYPRTVYTIMTVDEGNYIIITTQCGPQE